MFRFILELLKNYFSIYFIETGNWNALLISTIEFFNNSIVFAILFDRIAEPKVCDFLSGPF